MNQHIAQAVITDSWMSHELIIFNQPNQGSELKTWNKLLRKKERKTSFLNNCAFQVNLLWNLDISKGKDQKIKDQILLRQWFVFKIQVQNNWPMPWWWYSIEVTALNLKTSKWYSSIHQRRLERRNRTTSQLWETEKDIFSRAST